MGWSLPALAQGTGLVQEFAARWVHVQDQPLTATELDGESLYHKGIRRDGSPLVGQRSFGTVVSGPEAACVQCHRRSGLGTVEGDILVPPVTGRALYEPSTMSVVMDLRAKRILNTAHAPYGIESFTSALRDGQHLSGRPLHPLMPRYSVSHDDVVALDAYLRTLSNRWSPGVNAQKIRLASVVTPDVDANRRAVAVDMMRAMVNRKNLATRPGRRHMVSSLEFVLRTERTWEHEVWELTGPEETWLPQLLVLQGKNPVFAIASGLVGNGAALHSFCVSQRLPCWFPVTDAVPDAAGGDVYGLYFHQGVPLEVDAISRQIDANGGRVVQLVSQTPMARRAADRFDQVRSNAPSSEVIEFSPERRVAIGQQLASLQARDALLLWLTPEDMLDVTTLEAPRSSIWAGETLSRIEQAKLGASWRERMAVAYPYELPARREGNMSALKAWLGMAQKPLVDEALQSKLFFAFNYLNETLGSMLNNLHRDYLIERAEMMLGRREIETVNAQVIAQRSLRQSSVDQRLALEKAPARDPDARATVTMAELTAGREGTTIYPRLSLGSGQRFASRGVWIAKLAPVGSKDVFLPDAQWLIP